MLTDGMSSDDPVPVATELKTGGVLIFSVGVGNINMAQLKAISSGDDFVVHVNNFPQLNTKVQDIVKTACENSNCSK